jgi:hypothetical protein
MSGFNIGKEVLLASWGVVAPVSPASINIKIISVVVPLVVVLANNRVTLNNPDKFLNGVVEIEFNLNVGVNGRFITGELELFDEIFVRTLSEAAAFISVKVNIVDKESSSNKRWNTEQLVAVASGESKTTRRAIRRIGNTSDIEFFLIAEFNVNTNFVVLKSNERKSETRISATLIPHLSVYL